MPVQSKKEPELGTLVSLCKGILIRFVWSDCVFGNLNLCGSCLTIGLIKVNMIPLTGKVLHVLSSIARASVSVFSTIRHKPEDHNIGHSRHFDYSRMLLWIGCDRGNGIKRRQSHCLESSLRWSVGELAGITRPIRRFAQL